MPAGSLLQRTSHGLRIICRSRGLARIIFVSAVSVLVAASARSQNAGPSLVVQPTAAVHTVAGTGKEGYNGDHGAATSAAITAPTALVSDTDGNLYFADRDNHVIRKIDTAGVITTVAGAGLQGFGGDGGPATSALLDTPSGVAVDEAKNLYISDTRNQRVRMVSAAGVITTLAGNGTAGFCGDGGPAVNACLYNPRGISVDTSENVYVADSGNNCIRLISNGKISTVAGSPTQGMGGDGGAATSAQLNHPLGVTIASNGKLFIADSSNQRIRTVSAGVISALAGTGVVGDLGDGGPAISALLALPGAIREDPLGNMVVADTNNNRLREIAYDGNILSISGANLEGPPLGTVPASAVFDSPMDVLPTSTGFYVADTDNRLIRRVQLSALDFQRRPAGTVSAGLPITLGSNGTTPVTVSQITLAGGGFRMIPGGSCPLTLPFNIVPGTSCIVLVAFAPGSATNFAGKVELMDNDPESPQIVMLAGVGILNPLTLQLSYEPAHPIYGDPINLVATLTPKPATTAPTPIGNVKFSDSSSASASQVLAPLTSGSATMMPPCLDAGTHSVSAAYGGSALYTPASASVDVVVGKATPTISLVSSPNPVETGFPLELSASVQSPISVPTGTVNFLDGGNIVASVPLDKSGDAAFTISQYTAGTHAIKAAYTGDNNFNAVTSAQLASGPSTFTLSVSQLTSNGNTGTATVTVTPVNGFTQPVTLTCASLPANSNCNFAPATVKLANGKPATAVLTLNSQGLCSGGGSPATETAGSLTLPGILFLLLFGIRRKKFAVLLPAILLMATVAAFTSGCSGFKHACFTTQGTYTINVVGTAKVSSTKITNTAKVNFSVNSDGSLGN
jgi:Big-like domain-containing protein/NHL repeat-containing protein